jgi:hypothetical protein
MGEVVFLRVVPKAATPAAVNLVLGTQRVQQARRVRQVQKVHCDRRNQRTSHPQQFYPNALFVRLAQQLPVKYHLPSLPQVSSRPALQTIAPRE